MAARLVAAPLIAHGRLGDVLSTKLPFETRELPLLGLSPLRANLAEGLVATRLPLVSFGLVARKLVKPPANTIAT